LTQGFKTIETNIRPEHGSYDTDDEGRGDVDGVRGWERTDEDVGGRR